MGCAISAAKIVHAEINKGRILYGLCAITVGLFFFFCALLVGHSARSFASGLAAGLALAASGFLVGFHAGLHGCLNMFHFGFPHFIANKMLI